MTDDEKATKKHTRLKLRLEEARNYEAVKAAELMMSIWIIAALAGLLAYLMVGV